MIASVTYACYLPRIGSLLASFARPARVLAGSFACACLAAPAPAKLAFDLPADSAEKSLRLFSRQSGLEVMFVSTVAKGVRTQPVKGEMPPRAALDAMLAGTGLEVVGDETGAFSIQRRAAGPEEPGKDPPAQGGKNQDSVKKTNYRPKPKKR